MLENQKFYRKIKQNRLLGWCKMCMWKGYNTNEETFEQKLEGEKECMYLAEEHWEQREQPLHRFCRGSSSGIFENTKAGVARVE